MEWLISQQDSLMLNHNKKKTAIQYNKILKCDCIRYTEFVTTFCQVSSLNDNMWSSIVTLRW